MSGLYLGTDPGTSRFAATLLERTHDAKPWRYIDGGDVKWLKETKTRPADTLEARLKRIVELLEQLGCYNLALVSYEQQLRGKFMGAKFNSSNYGLWETVGFAKSLAIRKGAPYVCVDSKSVKKLVTTHGFAGKGAVANAVRVLVSNLPEKMSEHLSDACAIAIAGSYTEVKR
jgi:Holliday junction resolvasome RuvABC endonuclease subunit